MPAQNYILSTNANSHIPAKVLYPYSILIIDLIT